MEQVLLHIGYHKTASSWLQSELFVSGSPVFEPLSRTDRHQSSLALDFVIGRDGYLLPPLDDNREVIKQELRHIQQQRPLLNERIAVLSHERLSGNPHSSGFDAAAIAGRLAAVFPEAKVLIMVREQRSFILSSYFQYLRAGGSHSLESYLNTRYDGKRPGFSPHHIEYSGLVAEYQRLFSPRNVLVLPYEVFLHEPTAMLGQLAAFLGVSIEVDREVLARKVNPIESPYLASRLRLLNRWQTSSSLNDHSRLHSALGQRVFSTVRNFLQRFVSADREEKALAGMRAYIQRWSDGRFGQDNDRLMELTGLDLEGLGYQSGGESR